MQCRPLQFRHVADWTSSPPFDRYDQQTYADSNVQTGAKYLETIKSVNDRAAKKGCGATWAPGAIQEGVSDGLR
jgi:hypothetical protein